MRWIAILTILLAPVPAHATVYVATWTGPGLDTDPNPETNCWTTSAWDVRWWNEHLQELPIRERVVLIPIKDVHRWRHVLYTGVDPKTGIHVDVVYVPGGWRPEDHWGSDWVDLLRWAQLHLGIGYVGICAGATTYIRAFPCVKAVDGLKGHAEPRVLLLPHPANPLANEPGSTYEMRMYYANGPGMSFRRGWYTIKYYIDRRWHTVRAYCDVRGVAKYLEKVKGWAYVVGRWIVDGVEKGRFAIMSVHPEIMGRRNRDPDMVKMFVYALLWAAKRLPADWILTVSPGPTVIVPKPGKDRRVTLTATLTNWVNEPISEFPVEVTIEGPTRDRSLQLTTNEQGMVSVTVPVTREGEYRVRFRAVDASATVEIVAGRRERQPSPAAGLPILLALAALLRALQRSQRHLHQPTGHSVQHGRRQRIRVPNVAAGGDQ